jgi:hypothetical protein
MYQICEEMRFRLGLFVLLLFLTGRALASQSSRQAVDVYEASFSTKMHFEMDEICEAMRFGLGMLGLLLFRTGRALAHNRREQVIDA